MNAPSSVSAVSPQTIKPGQVLVIGRFSAVRKHQDTFYHLAQLPAPDEYSSPATVEVISKTRLGQTGDDCRVLCRLGGFKRTWQQKDKQTGEELTIATADIKLYAVE